ncbi:MAG TPA: type II secretion system secretin GspD [Casimicrobiaceae bacterium]|jgi:general secretion pathway protein D
MADEHDYAPHLIYRIVAAVRSGIATRSRLIFAVVAVGFMAAIPKALGQDSDTVTLNFVNADIDAVVKAVAEITGRNFVLDPRVKGTINIVSARPVPKSLVYPTLLSALRLQGFTAVEGDGIVKIVPEIDAKIQGGPVGAAGVTGDRLITQVIPLRNESAAQLVNVLRPLISANNTIAAFPASNALIITDYADNVRRLMRIITSLDQPPLGEPLIVPVKNASALDMVGTLNRALADGGGQPGAADARERVSLVAEPRSNSILVRSENPARAIRVRQLIEQLDTPQRAGGNIFIIYLKNADALRVAETLRGLYGGTTGGDRGLPAVTTATAAPTAATVSASITSSPAATTPLSTSGTAAGSAPIIAGAATIQADAANNALIIMAPEPIYNNLRAIIEKLDVRRAQVFIEALIVEVTADKAGEFGIQWQVLTGLDPRRTGIQGFGGTNFGARGGGNNIIDASVNIGRLGQGLNLGVINGTITIPGLGIISNIGLLVRALSTDANANILSTPTLLTLDNEEARVMVGSNVPFITGQYATTGSTSTVQPFQTIERHDVGLLLRVKPQITEGGAVRMVLYQEVSRVDQGTRTDATGPTLTKRSLESSVVVDDQQIVVLGGLIQDTFTDTTDKIPFAGDLPVLGGAFRYDTRTRTKTNLLIFIKPTVIRNAVDGRPITSQRYDYLRGEQADIQPQPRWFWPDTTFPELTPLPAMQGVAVPLPPGPGVAPRPAPPAK